MIQEFFFPCLWAFLASVAFGLVYNIHGGGILICGLGAPWGGLVYLAVQLLPIGSIPAAFAAAAAIAVFSECMARLRRCPVTGYLQVALLPLVPGSGIYYAMRHCVAGRPSCFYPPCSIPSGMAASLAVGAMLASTVLRIVLPHLPQRHKKT